ncbi:MULTISPECIES: ATP synthase subunit I [Salinicoccus]|uniref:ATP synthase subunit I n=1 Tax=Salinicoccus TaxID=45669 RepID=UPI001E4914CB|nr:MULTISPECIES: ATP synthase subunit I [Salinicoccus]MCD2138122.1 ATP synthase subunit I [Salinicoccus halitifaciens]
MSFFRRFYTHFLRYFSIPLIGSLLFAIFTQSSIAAGLFLGTAASTLMIFNWYYHLEQAQDEENGKVRLGVVTRFIIVIVTLLVWLRFPETFNIFAIAIGILLGYILIIFHAVRELTK